MSFILGIDIIEKTSGGVRDCGSPLASGGVGQGSSVRDSVNDDTTMSGCGDFYNDQADIGNSQHAEEAGQISQQFESEVGLSLNNQNKPKSSTPNQN